MIGRVAVVGAGTMGRQIALSIALHGLPVRLMDARPEALREAETFIDDRLARSAERGRLTGEAAEAARARLALVPSLEAAVADADLVIEAVVEDLDVKRRLFGDLDRLAPPGAILATNSSTIPSSQLAGATSRPALVANLHYFNPALVMELVEVVQGPHTSAETAGALMAFARATGKTPILLRKEVPGFVANRLLHALRREALWLLETGVATHADIDLAAEKGLGHPMGPFRIMDLVGLDVVRDVALQRHRESGLMEDRPHPLVESKVSEGRLGRKSGRGWYDYE